MRNDVLGAGWRGLVLAGLAVTALGCGNKVSPALVEQLDKQYADELATYKDQLKRLDANAQALKEKLAMAQKSNTQVSALGAEALKNAAPAAEKLDAARTGAQGAITALADMATGLAGKALKRQAYEELVTKLATASGAVPPKLTAYTQAISDLEALLSTWERSAVIEQQNINVGTKREDHD